jgi:hypothetical protein
MGESQYDPNEAPRPVSNFWVDRCGSALSHCQGVIVHLHALGVALVISPSIGERPYR